jgi:hypothetical protein
MHEKNINKNKFHFFFIFLKKKKFVSKKKKYATFSSIPQKAEVLK